MRRSEPLPRDEAIISGVQAPPSFRDLTLGDFAERLASPDPVPGGGSASAIAAALGASLVAMVATLSQGRPKYADHAALHEAAAPAARRLADELLELADEDARAYAACAFALKLPREAFADKEYRDQQVRETARVAAEVPLRCLEKCRDALTLAETLAGRSNVNAASDLRVAAHPLWHRRPRGDSRARRSRARSAIASGQRSRPTSLRTGIHLASLSSSVAVALRRWSISSGSSRRVPRSGSRALSSTSKATPRRSRRRS